MKPSTMTQQVNAAWVSLGMTNVLKIMISTVMGSLLQITSPLFFQEVWGWTTSLKTDLK